MWKEYSILGYKIVCKVLDIKSSFGIFGSRVVVLGIFKKGNKIIFDFGHGMFNNHNLQGVPNWVLHKIVDVIEWIS